MLAGGVGADREFREIQAGAGNETNAGPFYRLPGAGCRLYGLLTAVGRSRPRGGAPRRGRPAGARPDGCAWTQPDSECDARRGSYSNADGALGRGAMSAVPGAWLGQRRWPWGVPRAI